MSVFEEAVLAHEEWTRTFERAVRDDGGNLTVEHVRDVNRCPLGEWLQGRGKAALAGSPASMMLCDIHAEFHSAAADVLALALAGRTRAAVRALGETTPYGQWSAIMLNALKRYAETSG